ncbi:MAG: polysaccharide biosynthesis/export family protein [Acinetobacter sp.]|nr:polysaccharide biosynthesis/export family protein [Acinetobacter sp.]
MKYFQPSAFMLSFALLVSGCAVTPGFQSYDLPAEGVFQTEQGVAVNVVPITQDNLHQIRANRSSFNAQQQGSRDVAHLFKSASTVQYSLKPYDILSIQLWAYPEITPPVSNANSDTAKAAGYQIDANGYIQLPLVGRYKASGKSVAQVNKELHGQFARYLKHPDVIVRVLSYEGQRYSVQGYVNRGGQFYIDNQPVSVYTALGLAGGVTNQGDNTAIQLIRNGITYSLNPLELEKAGYSLHKLLLKPNDTLYVGEKANQKVYVMGESGKSQALQLRDQGMTLSDVIGESQGINAYSASAKRIYVLRTNTQTQETTIYVMDLSSLGNFGLANQFAMNRNDIVYVDQTGLTRWQRVVNQVIPFSNALYSISQLGTTN